ncbi:MAG: peptidase M50, partial [Pseudomonadales bacterium]|nr:peptidase M50 [Pseudomonadales bacterium]
VSAAGILAELFIAAIALFVWLTVEPGFIRDTALNAVLIASVSTLLFNANPLLRFDGYYILQDFIEIPNLYTRASRYYLYLIQRYGFGMQAVRSPVTAEGERAWFASYGMLAFCYRFFILFVIVMFLAEEYLVVGVALACWAIAMQIILPLVKGLRFLQASPALQGHRDRAIRVTAGSAIALGAAILVIPAPLTTQSEGVLWVAEQAQLYSKTNGFVGELLVEPGQIVEVGTPVIALDNPTLRAELAVTKAKQTELATQAASERRKNWIKSQIIEHQLDTVNAELALLKQKNEALLIRSQAVGTFVPADRNTLIGRYYKQGELIGYVVSPENLIVKAVIPQTSVGLLASGDSRARIRFAERVNQPVDAIVNRHTPSGKTQLPTAALGAAGGGAIAVSNADSSGTTAAEKIFEVELQLPASLPALAGIGERAYVRFYHGYEPLALQWWRSGRQLFLSQLGV